MKQSMTHARPCVVHPSKLTFNTCPNCGRPLCSVCLSGSGPCKQCLGHKKKVPRYITNKIAIRVLGILLLISTVINLFQFWSPTSFSRKAPLSSKPQTPDWSFPPPEPPAPRIPLNLLHQVQTASFRVFFQPGPWSPPLSDPDNFCSGFYDLPFSIVPEEPEAPLHALPVALSRQEPPDMHLMTPVTEYRPAEENVTASERPSVKKPVKRLAAKSRVTPKTPLASHLTGDNLLNKYNVENVPTQERVITLSFDGDHLDNCTSEILKILDNTGVKANIFLTGKFIELFPESVVAIRNAGHEIGNHTWNHPHLTDYEINRTQRTRKNITRAIFLDQLERTAKLYFEVSGEHFQPFWRAPFGEHNVEIRTWAYSAGYLHIGWTRGYDSMDWMINPRAKYYLSPSKLKKRLLGLLDSPGHKIVLMHLGSERPEPERPYMILEEFIEKAREKHYQFATISEVLRESQGFQMASVPLPKTNLPVSN